MIEANTIKAYNDNVSKYADRTDDFWDRQSDPKFIDTFMGKFDMCAKILDVGCGTGRDAAMFLGAGMDPVGIDASEGMVKECVSRGVVASVQDFCDIGFCDDTFDGAWAYTSLVHCPKERVQEPLSEILRVVKSNGVVGIAMLGGSGEEVINGKFFAFYESEEFVTQLENAGFVDVVIDVIPAVENYPRDTLQFLCRT